MDKNTALLLGLGLLAFGAYTVMKRKEGAVPLGVAPPVSTGPVVDQGVDPGVAPDATPGGGSGPSFPTEVLPDPPSGTGSVPPSGGNSTADEVAFFDRFKRERQSVDITQTKSGGITGQDGVRQIAQGVAGKRSLIILDEDKPRDPPAPTATPEEREAESLVG